MKKILMALTLVGLIQVSADAQSKDCTCKTKKHHAVKHHHMAYRHTKTMRPLVYRPLDQRTDNDMAISTATVPPTVPVAKAQTELVPDNLSGIGTPTVYKEKTIVWTGSENNGNGNVNLAPTSGRNANRTSPCRAINYAANNRVHAFAGYRRHNIVVNDDMNNPYQGEPSKQNDGVIKNEHRNLNAYQTGMVLPGNDGSRP